MSEMWVRVDSLKRGAVFIDAQGTWWTFERQDSANSGAYHATREHDGHKDCFAGCAKVVEVVAGSAPQTPISGSAAISRRHHQ